MTQQRKHVSNAARQAAYRQRQQRLRQQERQEKGLPPQPAIPTLPSHARWNQTLAMACALLSTLVSEMDAYADARSEAWQQSERGEAFSERLATLTDLSEQLDILL